VATKKRKPPKVKKSAKAKKTAPMSAASTRRAPPAKKRAPVATKRKGSPRTPPMHTQVNHPELDDEDHEEVFEIFRVYDRDGSGSIDRQEFARLLEALGSAPSEDELAVALDVVDANHSGKISWDEFKAWWTNR
jgi:hypothetical protein